MKFNRSGMTMIGKLLTTLTLFVAAICMASPVNAEQWVEVGTDNESVHYVDRDSMTRKGDVVTVRKKVIYHVAEVTSIAREGEAIKYSIGVIQEDCSGHQHRAISIELFNEAGTSLWASGDMRRVWESMEPESIGDRAREFACSMQQ
jgi:hypothetical protein